MNLSAVYNRASKLMTDNSPAILTGVGVVGTLATAFLAGKASWRASEIIADETAAAQVSTGDLTYEYTAKAKAKMVWKLYIPSLATAAVTCTSIVCANRIGAKRTAAMAAAFAVTERAYDEYATKVKEQIGKAKEQKVRDEVAQDRVKRDEVGKDLVVMGDGNVLCHDAYSGRFFSSNMEAIRKAENDVNKRIHANDAATLTDFYNAVGLEPTSQSDEIGWNTDKFLELGFSTTMTKEGKPALSYDFLSVPFPRPWQFV